MPTLTKTFTRPNATVHFPQRSTTAIAKVSSAYRGANPKITSATSSYNGNTMTTVTTFKDQASLDEYLADSVVADDLTAYCTANNITVTQTIA
jgi:hypothetical protein